jgi:hypothetical protein
MALLAGAVTGGPYTARPPGFSKAAMSRLFLPIAAFAACAAALPAQAVDARLREQIDRLPGEIHSVQTCGTWRGGGDAGVHRIVVADVDDGSELFVQWVRSPTPGRGAEVVHSRPIREFDEGQARVSIQSVRCVTQGKGSSLEIRGLIEHDASPKVHAWLLTLLPGGGYELKETTR